MKRKLPILVLLAAAAAAAVYFGALRRPHEIVLTGIVTTDEIIVSPEIQGRLQQTLVREGDAVTNHQLLALIKPQEWRQDVAFYAQTEKQSAAQVTQAEAELKFQEVQTTNQVLQAEATLASIKAQVTQAEADLDLAVKNLDRERGLYKKGAESVQVLDQMRTTKESAQARVDSLRKQVLAAQATVALAQSNEELVTVRRAGLEVVKHQMEAVGAQKEKAQVRLDYTEIRAPMNGLVDVRVALEGEVVNPAQPVLTLLNPDNLWVRADIEESFIGRIKLGDKMQVQLPSGVKREGTVFFRGVDADYATQRDVSRTKRDIKTFQIRLRCDNRNRDMAVGMTAHVVLPL